MAKGISINNGTAKALILVAGLATICFLSACTAVTAYNKNTAKTGLYSVKGWNYDKACHYGKCGTDINGKVGYPLFVSSPRARCEPSGEWSMSRIVITSGTLPPGLTLESGPSNIRGIPEKRGHWIVNIKVDNLYCEGKSYSGFEQELRFHITGSGRVTQ